MFRAGFLNVSRIWFCGFASRFLCLGSLGMFGAIDCGLDCSFASHCMFQNSFGAAGEFWFGVTFLVSWFGTISKRRFKDDSKLKEDFGVFLLAYRFVFRKF